MSGKNDYSGPSYRVPSDTPNLSYLTFNVSRNQKIYFADRLSKQLESFSPENDWSVHYQRMPSGEAPQWVKSLLRAQKSSARGGLFALQNRKDLEIAYEGLVAESKKLAKQSGELPLEDSVRRALERMAHEEGPDGPIRRMLDKYSFSDQRFRIVTSEDPNLLPQSVRGSASPIHSQLNGAGGMHDRVVGVGRFMNQGGEVVFGTHTSYGAMFAMDADGDQLTHALVFRDKSTGERKYVVGPSKAPGHKRQGYYRVDNDLDPLGFLQESALGVRAHTPSTYGDLGASVRNQAIDPLRQAVKQLSLKKETTEAIAKYGLTEFKKMDFGGITGEELLNQQIIDTTKELTKGMDVGLKHNKVVTRELFEIFGTLTKGQLEEMSVAELNQYIAKRLGQGDERYNLLEKGVLKTLKKGTGMDPSSIEDVMEFNQMLKDSARIYLQQEKNISGKNSIEYLEMLAELVGENGAEAIAKESPQALRKMMESRYFSLGSAFKSNGGNPFRPSKKIETVRTRLNINPLVKNSNRGIFEVLEESGFYNLKPILTPDEMIPTEFRTDFGKMHALVTDLGMGFGDQSLMKSPLGHTPTQDNLLYTGVLTPTVISDVEKGTRTKLSGREALRRYVNNTLREGYTTTFKGSSVTIKLGEATSLYAPETMANPNYARRIAKDFVRNKLDVLHTGLSLDAPELTRIQAMTQVVMKYGNNPNSADFQRFVVQAQLASEGGQTLLKEINNESQNFIHEFTKQANLIINDANATYQSTDLARVHAGTMHVTLAGATNDPTELAEGIAFTREEFTLADSVGKMKRNRTAAVELGNVYGQQRRVGGDLGIHAKRVNLIKSQLSALSVEAKVAYTEQDLVDSLRSGTSLSRREVADKFYKSLDPDELTRSELSGRGGAGQLVTSEQLRRKFEERLEDIALPDLNLDELTDEQAKSIGAYRKGDKWVLNIKNWDNLRKYSKIVSESGTHKVQQTVVDSIKTVGGEELDALMFGGEVAEKRKFGDLALNIFTEAAARKKWTGDEVFGHLKDILDKLDNLEAERNRFNYTDEVYNQKLIELYQPYMNMAGFSQQDITVTKAGSQVNQKAYVGSVKLFSVMNETELPNQLSKPNIINVGTEYGQKELDNVVENLAQFMSDEFGVDFDSFRDRFGIEVREAGMNASRTFYDEFGQVTNKDLAIKAQQNAAIAIQIQKVLQLGGNTDNLVGVNTTTQAYQAGQRAAAAEYMGGQIYNDLFEHLDQAVNKVNWKSAGIAGAVLVGAQLLNKRREEKRKRS